VHGPRKLIDVAEADAWWEPTKTAQGAGGAEAAQARGHPPDAALARARAAALVADLHLRRLRLEQQRAALVSRDLAVVKAHAFRTMVCAAIRGWPARVGPALAATFGRDAEAMTSALEETVEDLVAELADERIEF
jgi:hypothetical protein